MTERQSRSTEILPVTQETTQTEILPVAQEATDTQTRSSPQLLNETHVVLGIPVQSLEQADKVRRLLWISFGWMSMVTIDHSCSIHYSNVNAKDLYECRQVTASESGRPSTTTDPETYANFVLAGYIFSWVIGLAIPCIGYSGAKKRLRGHINVFRVFGGCFSFISWIVTIDNFMAAYSASNLSQEYFDQAHDSCARLATDAELIHIVFGVISMMLAMTQCAAFGFAHSVYNDGEFWNNPLPIRGIGPTPISIRSHEMEELEAQSHQVPFARVELQSLPNHAVIEGVVAQHETGSSFNGEDDDIPTAKEMTRSPPKRSMVRRLSLRK